MKNDLITEAQRLKAARDIVYRYNEPISVKDYAFLFGSWIVSKNTQCLTNARVAVRTTKHVDLPVIDTQKDQNFDWNRFNLYFTRILKKLNATKQYCEIPLSEAVIKRIGKEGQKEYYADDPERLIKYGDTWVTKWNLYLAVYALGGENTKLKYFMDDNKDKIVILSSNGIAVIAEIVRGDLND
jgi:hypothetical protein